MLSCLKSEGVEFIVVGAYALAAHGFPRATGDLLKNKLASGRDKDQGDIAWLKKN